MRKILFADRLLCRLRTSFLRQFAVITPPLALALLSLAPALPVHAQASLEPAGFLFADDINGQPHAESSASADSVVSVDVAAVEVPDENLREALLQALGLPQGEITVMDMESLTDLNLRNKGIADLTGLGAAVNLVKLNLSVNRDIVDLKPLEPLVNLQWLELDYNRNIQSFSPLSELPALRVLTLNAHSSLDVESLAAVTQLTTLEVPNCGLENPEALAALVNLEVLDIGRNPLTHIDFLANMPNMRELSLEYIDTEIVDFSALGALTELEWLSLNWSGIADISPLANCAKLKSLHASSNYIRDLSPLEDLTSLEYLNLHENQIESVEPLLDLVNLTTLNLSNNAVHNIEALYKMTQMEYLYLTTNYIINIEAIEQMTLLRTLNIGANHVNDFGPLSALANLRDLYAEYSGLQDLTLISSSNLRRIYLTGNHIYSLEPLASQTGLTHLYVGDNGLTSIADIAGFESSLVELELNNNPIGSVATLSGMTDLQRLYLQNCGLASIGPLEELTQIRTLDISHNQVSDLSPLANMADLYELRLTGNPLAGSNLSPLTGLAGLQNLYLASCGLSSLLSIAEMPAVSTLSVAFNNLESLAPLSEWNALRELNVSGNRLASLDPLAGLETLDWVCADDNQLTDIRFITECPKMRILYVLDNQIDTGDPEYIAFRNAWEVDGWRRDIIDAFQTPTAETGGGQVSDDGEHGDGSADDGLIASDGLYPGAVLLQWPRENTGAQWSLYRSATPDRAAAELIASNLTVNRYTDYVDAMVNDGQAWYYWVESGFEEQGTPAWSRFDRGSPAIIRDRIVTWGQTDTISQVDLSLAANAETYTLGMTGGACISIGHGLHYWGDEAFFNGHIDEGYDRAQEVYATYFNFFTQSPTGYVLHFGETRHDQLYNYDRELLKYNKVDAGGYHMLGMIGGFVHAWGNNDRGQCNITVGMLSFPSEVAAGGYHSLVLYRNGVLVAVGDNRYGQTDIPDRLLGLQLDSADDYIKIDAGMRHSVVLLAGGDIVCWGSNERGQCDFPQEKVPDGVSVVDISCGPYHNLALLDNGQVIAWGYGADSLTKIPGDLMEATYIAAGGTGNLVRGYTEPWAGFWKCMSWFGTTAPGPDSQVWSYDLGWLTTDSTTAADVMVWSPGQLGWFWTQNGVYPWVWSWDMDTWLYYYGGDGDGSGAWFYNLAADENQWLFSAI